MFYFVTLTVTKGCVYMSKFGTAVILAGGKASRMGFDKQFLKIKGVSIVESIVEELEKEFDEIIIISNKAEEYEGHKHRVEPDIIEGKGPLSGIHTGLSLGKSDYMFFIACDMPNVSLDYIRYMKKRIRDNTEACISRVDKGLEPFHGFYSKTLVGPIEDYLKSEKRSIFRFLEDKNVTYIDESEIKEEGFNQVFLNINTPEDLETYLKSI